MKNLINLLAWTYQKENKTIVAIIVLGIVLALLIGAFAPLPANTKLKMIRPFDDSIYPVVISGRFGAPRNQTMGGNQYEHTGIDYKLEKGTNLRAVYDGVVIFAEDSEAGYGNLVKIDHGNGLVTYYAHLLRPDVKEGQTVRQGDLIGKVGNSGRSFGYHCHFEVRLNGKPVHPAQFVF
jgi:murein DD-endopeptidase MepM/ murein hydrolase activator NlpD